MAASRDIISFSVHRSFNLSLHAQLQTVFLSPSCHFYYRALTTAVLNEGSKIKISFGFYLWCTEISPHCPKALHSLCTAAQFMTSSFMLSNVSKLFTHRSIASKTITFCSLNILYAVLRKIRIWTVPEDKQGCDVLLCTKHTSSTQQGQFTQSVNTMVVYLWFEQYLVNCSLQVHMKIIALY